MVDQFPGTGHAQFLVERDHQCRRLAAVTPGSIGARICALVKAQSLESAARGKTADAFRMEIDALDAAGENDRAGACAHVPRGIDDRAQTRRSYLSRDLTGRIDIPAGAVQMHGGYASGTRVIYEFTEFDLIPRDDMASQPEFLARDRHFTGASADASNQ